MSLVNGGVESIAAADSRSPPPDAGRRGAYQSKSPARWAAGADPCTQWSIPFKRKIPRTVFCSRPV